MKSTFWILGIALLVMAGCGGNGGSLVSQPPNGNAMQSMQGMTASPSPQPSATTISGSVTGVVDATKFYLGKYTVVYAESNVTPSNGLIKYNQNVSVVGSVTSPGLLTSTTVSILGPTPIPTMAPTPTPSPQPTTIAGSVTGVGGTTTFYLGKYIVVYAESNVTPNNGQIKYNENVSVVGTVSSPGLFTSTSVNILGPTPIPTIAPSATPTPSPSPQPSATTISGAVTGVLGTTKFYLGKYAVVYAESNVTPSNGLIKYNENVSVLGNASSPGLFTSTSVDILGPTPIPTIAPSASPTPTIAPSASPTPTIAPSATPTGSTTGPYHIDTYAYDQTYGEAHGVGLGQINQLLTFAQGDKKALNDCHSGTHACKAVYYFRPFAEVASTPSSCSEEPDASVLAAASENWYLHYPGYADAAHRVVGKDAGGCLMYAMNSDNMAMQAWWLNYLRANANNYDLFFVDEEPMDIVDATSFQSGGGCNGTYCKTTQEIGADPAMEASHVGFMQGLTYTQGAPMQLIYQQAYPARTQSLDLTAMGTSSNYMGVSCEGCITNTGSTIVPNNYKPFLDEMAAIIAANKTFLVIADGDAPSGSSTEILQRLVTTGIMWLAYSEGHTFVQPNLERYTKNLAVWPEDLIYPSKPIQTMVSGADDLQVAPGVWRREFSTCYQMGHSFGRCAAIVNSTSSAVTVQGAWLSQSYKHMASLSGGDVISGGTASVGTSTFTPGVTTIQAGGALLATQ